MTDLTRPQALTPLLNTLGAYLKSGQSSQAFSKQLSSLQFPDPLGGGSAPGNGFGPAITLSLSFDAELVLTRGPDGFDFEPRRDRPDPTEQIIDAEFRDEIAFEFDSSTEAVRALARETLADGLDDEARVRLEEALAVFEEISAGLREAFEASGGELTEDDADALLEAFFDAEEAVFEVIDEVTEPDLSEEQEALADEFISGFEGIFDAFDAVRGDRSLSDTEEARVEEAEANFFAVFDDVFAEEAEVTEEGRALLEEALRSFAEIVFEDLL